MGSEKIVPNVQPGVEIVIDYIGGDFIVTGRASSDIKAAGDNPRLSVEDDGKRIRISCEGDCTLRVPADASLSIQDIGGDGRITEVSGTVSINTVGGDLILRDTGPVHLQSVGGDLELKRIAGKAEVNNVGGDINFWDIEGELNGSSVGGDLCVTNADGSCVFDDIGGDLAINTNFAAGSHYRYQNVGGDVLGKVRPDASVRFIIPAETETSVNLDDAQITNDGDRCVITIGDGAATVEFDEIGGDFTLIGAGPGDQFAPDQSFDFSFPENLADIITARVSEQIAPLLDNVKRQTERIQREVEQNAERARQRTESRTRTWSHGWSSEKPKRGGPPTPPTPPGAFGGEKSKRETVNPDPVSDEERMAILRMVESKQISVEEAERLLAALEGSD